jgi:hypothetical protein
MVSTILVTPCHVRVPNGAHHTDAHSPISPSLHTHTSSTFPFPRTQVCEGPETRSLGDGAHEKLRITAAQQHRLRHSP